MVSKPRQTRRSKSAPLGANPLSDAEYGALGQFRKAMRDFLAFSEASAREQGLTSQQHQALLAIRSHVGPEDMTVGELAECMLIKNHTAVELAGRLIERRLAVRRESETDRRRVLLELTEEGAMHLEAISRRNLHQLQETAEILSELLSTARRLQGVDADDEGDGSSRAGAGDVAKYR